MTVKEIKHKFFAYRNGVVAETLRRSGMPYKIIFGLDLPTIATIAREKGLSDETADILWEERDVRESRLLAIHLFDHNTISIERALRLCEDVQTREEADILAFRLLRHLAYFNEIKEIITRDMPLSPLTETIKKYN